MKATQLFLGKGWRRTGVINLVLASICGVVILVSLSMSVAQSETGSKLHSRQIYKGRFFQGERFNLIIATPAFKESYRLPVDILTSGGAFSPVQEPVQHNVSEEMVDGYRGATRLIVYQRSDSGIPQTIDSILQQGSKWDSLDVENCLKEYRSPRYRSSYTDLIVNVSSGTNGTQEWLRNQEFELIKGDLHELWDSKVPPDQIKPLLFWTRCRKERFRVEEDNCDLILSQPVSFVKAAGFEDITVKEVIHDYKAINEVDTKSCLAKPVETCQVFLSNGLLLAVLLCVIVKIATCATILMHQQDPSLVTPGDAIESFITDPDIYTRGLATLDIRDSQRFQCSSRDVLTIPNDTYFVSLIRPRQWRGSRHQLGSTILQGAWIETYFSCSIALVGLYMVYVARLNLDSDATFKAFGPSEDVRTIDIIGGLGYLSTLIIINMPQLILSFIYLTINMLHTQLQTEREWSSYGQSHIPLRVSYPEGQQISTYRLQLPYKYSIPLIGTSTFLHWLVSNSMFILIINGRSDLKPSESLRTDFRLPEGTFVGVGYSDLSILFVLIFGTLFVLSPLFVKGVKRKSDMVLGGTNSLVLSAACHVPQSRRLSEGSNTPTRPAQARSESAEGESISTEGLQLIEPDPTSINLTNMEDDREYLVAVSRQRLRWGVTSLPQALKRDISVDNDEQVMHLSFGTEEHGVLPPQVGALYT
ncbi:hypothetical protein PG987_012121 [Apiospora arundinis]